MKSSIRFSWLLRLGMVLAVVFAFSAAVFSLSASAPGLQPDHITLTWSNDPRTTQTISWRTASTTEPGWVEYRESGKKQGHKVTAVVEAMPGGLGSLHSVTLTGLQPNTQYQYQVESGKQQSERYTFTTAPREGTAFSFLVFGDSQSYDYKVWGKTLQQAYAAHPYAAFMVNVGDLVDVGQSETEWQGWFEGAKGVLEQLPLVPVVGNHETYTSQRVFSMPIYFTAQFKLPKNGPNGLQGQVYSFDYGDVHFSVLDTQLGEERQFVPEMLNWQKAWLEKDLYLTRKKWKVVLMHRPLYSNNSGGGEELRKVFLPLFDKYQVDVVFSGHDHVYARTAPLIGGVPGPEGRGTIYVATGRSGTKFYPKAAAKVTDVFFYNPQSGPIYLSVEVATNRFHVQALTSDGKLLEEWELTK